MGHRILVYLNNGKKYKHERKEDVIIYRCRVWHLRQIRANLQSKKRHGQTGCYSERNSIWRRFSENIQNRNIRIIAIAQFYEKKWWAFNRNKYLFNQNETHDMTTSKIHGPYTWMMKLPMRRFKMNSIKSADRGSVEYSIKKQPIYEW